MKGNYKMKVSIFGGTGFVGEYIINELIKANNKPYALVRYGNYNKISNKEKASFLYSIKGSLLP